MQTGANRPKVLTRNEVRAGALELCVQTERAYPPVTRHESATGLLQAAALFAQTRNLSKKQFERMARAAYLAAEEADRLRRGEIQRPRLLDANGRPN